MSSFASGMSITQQAINVLQQNNMSPECLLEKMMNTSQDRITFKDEQHQIWEYVSRRRCRLFLLVKAPEMNKYEDIYCSARL